MAARFLGWRFRPFMSVYMLGVHILAVAGLISLFRPDVATFRLVLEVILLWQITGLGITAGAHRLWAHRSYKASLSVRVFLMVCNTICNQGSILDWCRVHRVHHKFSDTSGDPHNINRGLLYSHVGWIVLERPEEVSRNEEKIPLQDLRSDPVVMWQWRHYKVLGLMSCFALPSLYGWLAHGSLLIGFLVHGCLRYAVTLNATWCVNSLAHMFGDRPYDKALPAAENPFVAWLTAGEGWHNWHHVYPFDYATSEFGLSRRFNTSKLLIDTCAFFGLVTDRKRATEHWKTRKMKLGART